MRAIDIMNEMFAWAEADFEGVRTCDTCKAGDPEREVSKVAVTCFNTPEVIRQAAAWGAQLLICHEPTYYDHWDERADTPVGNAKHQLIEETGLTIYRYHDHPHRAPVDMICAGELEAMGFEGVPQQTGYFGTYHYELKQPMTPRELARMLEERLHIAHVRICGVMDEPCTRVTTSFGTPAGVFEELMGDAEIVLTGEACEWKLDEYVRDAAQLGFKKAMLVLGHCGSERDGMKYIADKLAKAEPGLEVRYFECGEVYGYAEQ